VLRFAASKVHLQGHALITTALKDVLSSVDSDIANFEIPVVCLLGTDLCLL
jgi:hypothetical protein